MPPLKTPAAFHEQIRSLERARTGNFLKHKLCSRPNRSELVRMHILQETQAEPSLQATQMKLKRARLADDLNEKIAQRPGAMELVEKNILHSSPLTDKQKVDSNDNCFTSVIEKSEACKEKDVYKFDEDNSDALSPEQPTSQETPNSTAGSLKESEGNEANSTPSQFNSSMQTSPQANSHFTTETVNPVSTSEQQGNLQASTHQSVITFPSITPAPVLVKQSLHRLWGEKTRSKKSKEPKPRMKKLKYHQYIPPDQKQDLSEVPMDSAYARLLQQQQQFLQLQILNHQQQQYSHHGILPVKLKTEVQTIGSSGVNEDATSPPLQPCHTQLTCKMDPLPSNLDEMKVAELKMELKLRSLPVSGTKTDLIERLKLYQGTSNMHTTATMETSTRTEVQSENIKLSPPVSPIASKVSSLGIEDNSVVDSSGRLSESLTHTAPCSNSPHRFLQEFSQGRSCEKDSEKDKRLHEKERQIEELMRKLEQEQRLVEELKMQLEVEKRSQQGESPPQLSPTSPIQVKQENLSPSNCLSSCQTGQAAVAVLVKQEEAADQSLLPPPSQCNVSHQTTKPETLQSVQAGAQPFLSASSPASTVTIQLPTSGIKLHTNVSSLIQTSGQLPQKTEAPAVLEHQCSTRSLPLTRTWRMETTTQSLLNAFPASEHPAGANKQPQVINHASKCKDPPCYEDAVKQTHKLLITAQTNAAASQQMDDLFDVLIESGEISPFVRHNPSSLDKPLPVTASLTTLPINTVLSRPPPMVQVAQLPVVPFNPATSLSLTSDTKLGTLLDVSLSADTEAQSLTLIEQLHSPLVTMEVDFNENMHPPALTLNSTNMDNMDWLDLTLSVSGDGENPLDMSAPVGVFSSDFLDSNELHLNWD